MMWFQDSVTLHRLILEYPGIFISETQLKLFETFGAEISPTIYRILETMRYSPQKI